MFNLLDISIDIDSLSTSCLIHLVPKMRDKSILSTSQQACETNLPLEVQLDLKKAWGTFVWLGEKNLSYLTSDITCPCFQPDENIWRCAKKSPKIFLLELRCRIVKRKIYPDEKSVFKLSGIARQVEWCSLCSLIICFDIQQSPHKYDSYRVRRMISSSNLRS